MLRRSGVLSPRRAAAGPGWPLTSPKGPCTDQLCRLRIASPKLNVTAAQVPVIHYTAGLLNDLRVSSLQPLHSLLLVNLDSLPSPGQAVIWVGTRSCKASWHGSWFIAESHVWHHDLPTGIVLKIPRS